MIIRIGKVGYPPNYNTVDDAIIYACQNGARVIVICSSVTGNYSSVEDALSFAYHSFGVVIVAAAGNDYPYSIYFPATDEHVIAVGATTSNDIKAGFSCYGPDLDLAAPGVNIYSTTISNGYEGSDEGTGTSFAAPQVAATVALLLSVNPYLTPDGVREILINSAEKVGGYTYTGQPSRCDELGYGRLNVYNALSSIYPVLEGDYYVCGSNVTYTIDNYPTGASTTWSKSSNLNYVSSTNTTYTVTSNGNGSGWIQASINTGLFNPITIQKDVSVGLSRYITGENQVILDNVGQWQTAGPACDYSYAWYVVGHQDPIYTGGKYLNYTFYDEEWSPGYIQLYCKVSYGQSYINTDNFLVQLIAHDPLSAEITGNETVCLDDQGIWAANATGGDGEYTFEWYINDEYIDLGDPHFPYLYYDFDSEEWTTGYYNHIDLRVYDDSTYYDAEPFNFAIEWCYQMRGDSIQIYPNPADDYLEITIIDRVDINQKSRDDNKPVTQEVYNISILNNLGTSMSQKITSERIVRLSTSHLINGVYNIKVISSKGVTNKKVLISH